MKLNLLSRYGDETEAWVNDFAEPLLVDSRGFSLIDLSRHPYFPIPRAMSTADQEPVKYWLDGFLMRPSPGIPSSWLNLPETSHAYAMHLELLTQAVLLLTGKLVAGVDK